MGHILGISDPIPVLGIDGQMIALLKYPAQLDLLPTSFSGKNHAAIYHGIDPARSPLIQTLSIQGIGQSFAIGVTQAFNLFGRNRNPKILLQQLMRLVVDFFLPGMTTQFLKIRANPKAIQTDAKRMI